MKLKELNTPFVKKRILTHGSDGNTAVRRYVELQQITGSLYKSRTEIVGWGYEQCRLYLFFPGCPAGLDLGHLSFFGERTVEDMEQDYISNGLDSPEHFIETTDRQVSNGGFIGNPLIEFVKGWSPEKAAEYAAIRQSRLDELENRHAREAEKRLEARKRQGERTKQEKEARKASLLGWGDTMPELQLNRALAVLSKQYRYDGTVKTRRQHVIDCVGEGYRPEYWESRKEYRLVRHEGIALLSYPITKTEYMFALYLCNERIGQNA